MCLSKPLRHTTRKAVTTLIVVPVLSVKWWIPRIVPTNHRAPFPSADRRLRVMTSNVMLAMFVKSMTLLAIVLTVSQGRFVSQRVKVTVVQGKPMISKRENVCPLHVNLRT